MFNLKDTIQKELKNGASIDEVCRNHKLSFSELTSYLREKQSFNDTPKLPKYIRRNCNRYYIRHKHIEYGSYMNFTEACKVKEELKELNWDADPLDYLGDKYIGKARDGKYTIMKKGENNFPVYYGRYKSLEFARTVRDCLVRFNWDKDYLPLILRSLNYGN